jgi:DNA-binding response OmpR family regulator
MVKNVLFLNRSSRRTVCLDILKKNSFRVDTVHDSTAAIQKLERQDYDIVILQEAPLAESWQFCRDVRHISTLPLIVISNNASTEVCVRAINAGADFFLRKPFSPLELLARIRALLYRSALQAGYQSRRPVPAGY